jgi:hypothetical protein
MDAPKACEKVYGASTKVSREVSEIERGVDESGGLKWGGA